MKATMFAASAAAMASSAMAAQFVMYTPGGDDAAVERIDPIVNWGKGKHSAHVHQLFGANGLSPDMTHNSLLESTCTNIGDAAGRQNMADMSVYWHPALYMEAKDGSGYIRVPVKSHKLYYRNIGNENDQLNEPFDFPSGYRALAGHPTNRAPSTDGIVLWNCYTNGGNIMGVNGMFPEGITDCEDFPGLNAHIHFAHCWNGKDFNPDDMNAHYAYPEGDPQSGPCPITHPIRIPHIFSENEYDLHAVVNQVKPGTFVLSNGDATGAGYHADFFNGWVPGALDELFATCPQGQWGNHDIGTCPSFKAGAATTECHQTRTFHEEVDAPGDHLPGCNPIINTSPAPKFQIAPLGDCLAECPKAGTAHKEPSLTDTIKSHVDNAKDKIGGYLKPTTTLATSTKPTSTKPTSTKPTSTKPTSTKPTSTKPTSTKPTSTKPTTTLVTTTEPGANPYEVIDWVTEVVTVTAAPTLAGYGYHKRHAHMDKHRNHARSL